MVKENSRHPKPNQIYSRVIFDSLGIVEALEYLLYYGTTGR